jgi:hypothetical protein
MRRFTELSDDEMANHISWISTYWPQALLVSARTVGENSSGEEELITKIAKQYQAQMAAELARVPAYGPEGLIVISQTEDLDGFCDDGMKGGRPHTYELSNIGAVDMQEGDRIGVCIQVPFALRMSCGLWKIRIHSHTPFIQSILTPRLFRKAVRGRV